MAGTDEPTGKAEGESVQPPTVPIKGVNVPDPTAGGRAGDDPVEAAERRPDDPDKAAEDGLA